MRKQEKTVLITGATSGIGFALAKKFRKEGYHLILVSSSKERLRKTKALLKRLAIYAQKSGKMPGGHLSAGRITVICQDLSLPGAAKEMYRQLGQQNLSVDILVNNAGIGLVGEAAFHDLKKEEALLRVNVQAVTQLCTLFLKERYQRGSGKILNVASMGAFQPGPYTAAYYASKAYVDSYSRAIRCEAAKKGIQVCTLYPGTTRTDFFRKAGAKTPFWAMPADRVAKAAYNGLMKDKEIIVPGILNRILRRMPAWIKQKGIAVLKKER